MAIPAQSEIQIPLLEEIEKAGGSIQARDALASVTARFPQVTTQDLQTVLPGGNKKWYNWVHWTRQALAAKGEIDSPARGVWRITEKGRGRLGALGAPLAVRRRKRHGERRRQAVMERGESVNHDELAHAMEKMGRAFGFESRWKPSVNELRPDKRAFRSKRKTLDLAWRIGTSTWVPIEVQVGGSVPDLIYRFQQVHQWSVRLIVVTVHGFAAEIREALQDYPFRDKVVVLEPKEVLAATKSIDRLLELRNAIFE